MTEATGVFSSKRQTSTEKLLGQVLGLRRGLLR